MPMATLRSAAFAAANAVNGGRARSEAVAPVKISVPPPAGSMRFAASRPTRKPPKQPTRRARMRAPSQKSSRISSSGPMRALPAL